MKCKCWDKLFCLLVLLFTLSENGEVKSAEVTAKWPKKILKLISGFPLARSIFNQTGQLTTEKLIKDQGYPVEAHNVTTQDGYILGMHRIPFGIHPRKRPPSSNASRTPVIVFHGNSQSSADFVINTPREDSLGFHLADSGYDVWLINQRGNLYCSQHTSLNKSSGKFWNFGVHEIGYYDLPSIIDYVLLTAGQRKAHFIGFSLSNAAFLVALAKRPEYNQKLTGAILLGPAGIYYDGCFNGMLKYFKYLTPAYKTFYHLMGDRPAMPDIMIRISRRVLPIICHPKVDMFGICIFLMRLMFGNDKGLITKDKMHLISRITPTPFPIRMGMHALQQISSGEFNEFDFGMETNFKNYGRPSPPKYNLTNIMIPVAIIVGKNDFLASPQDAKLLAEKLPNVIDFYYVNYTNFRHLDFCYGSGVGKLVYEKVVEYLDIFSSLSN